MKENTKNLEERFRKTQLDLWQQLFKIWERTRDSAFLAELIRVDLKLKTESKQIRSVKFDAEWRDATKDQVQTLAEKQLVAFSKLRLFGVFPKAVQQSLARPDSLLRALTLLSQHDL